MQKLSEHDTILLSFLNIRYEQNGKGEINMKKFLALCVCIIMLTGLITGCGNGNKAGDGNYKGIKVFYSTADTKDTFISMIEEAASNYAKEQGIDMDVVDAENDMVKQVADIKEAAKSGDYDAMVVCPVNAETSTQIMDVAGDLPIIFINRSPAENKLKSDKYVFVGSDENDSAGFQAEFLTKYFSDKGKTDVKAVLFQGQAGHSAATQRTAAVKRDLKENGLNVEYVFNDTANWSRTEAQEMFNKFLKMGKEYDCVICNNDEMALGVIAAMKENNIDPSTIPVVGIDATGDGCGAIKAGDMAFTVYQSAKGQGSEAIQAAAILATGGSVSSIEGTNEMKTVIWVPFEKVDASNVDKYMK